MLDKPMPNGWMLVKSLPVSSSQFGIHLSISCRRILCTKMRMSSVSSGDVCLLPVHCSSFQQFFWAAAAWHTLWCLLAGQNCEKMIHPFWLCLHFTEWMPKIEQWDAQERKMRCLSVTGWWMIKEEKWDATWVSEQPGLAFESLVFDFVVDAGSAWNTVHLAHGTGSTNIHNPSACCMHLNETVQWQLQVASRSVLMVVVTVDGRGASQRSPATWLAPIHSGRPGHNTELSCDCQTDWVTKDQD